MNAAELQDILDAVPADQSAVYLPPADEWHIDQDVNIPLHVTDIHSNATFRIGHGSIRRSPLANSMLTFHRATYQQLAGPDTVAALTYPRTLNEVSDQQPLVLNKEIA